MSKDFSDAVCSVALFCTAWDVNTLDIDTLFFYQCVQNSRLMNVKSNPKQSLYMLTCHDI